jgi:hypothetical protein
MAASLPLYLCACTPSSLLCDTATARLATVQKNRTVDYNRVDMMELSQKKWRDVYEFDAPILHVERVFRT